MKFLNKKGISVVEYAVLMIIVISAFLVMRNYIQRGIFGNWGKTGQSFAYGRQYDPQKTIECAYDQQSNSWYDRNCYVYYVNANGCNNIVPNYCASHAKCDPVTNQCPDGNTCGAQECEEPIITGSCSASSGSSCNNLNAGPSS